MTQGSELRPSVQIPPAMGCSSTFFYTTGAAAFLRDFGLSWPYVGQCADGEGMELTVRLSGFKQSGLV